MWTRKQPPQRQSAHEVALRVAHNASLFDVGPRVFKHLPVMHPGGAHGFARETAEAKVKFLAERLRHPELSIGNTAHQCDASSRTVALQFRFVVGRAGRQAHSTVDALLKHRVVRRTRKSLS